MSYFTDDLDRIDAAVFSGDALESEDNRKALETMAQSWLRAVKDRDMQLAMASNCPHCNQPVLFAHIPDAVMIDAMADGIRIRTGPYHGECGKIVAQRGSCIDRDASAPAMPTQRG